MESELTPKQISEELREAANWHDGDMYALHMELGADTIERLMEERDALKAEVEQLRGDLEKWKDWSGSLPSSWFARGH